MDSYHITGFQSPAEDYSEKPLLIDDLLITNKISTYFMLIDSSQWQDMGISVSDIIVIDRSLNPKLGDKIIILRDGELYLKEFKPPSNHDNSDDLFSHTYELWGVITSVIHRFRKMNRGS